jgi:hypothetical protein
MDVVWPFLIPIVALVGAFTVAVVNAMMRARVRELEIRERIAMIEKGLVPSPELDPAGFDRAMGRVQRVHGASHVEKLRGGGIVLIGVGIGLMLLIGMNGDFRNGLGVGGLVAFIGAALLINALLQMRTTPRNGSAPVAGSASGPPDQNR